MQPNSAGPDGDRVDRLVGSLARILGLSAASLTGETPASAVDVAAPLSPEDRRVLVDRRVSLIRQRAEHEASCGEKRVAANLRIEAARRALVEPSRLLKEAEAEAEALEWASSLRGDAIGREIGCIEWDLRDSADPQILAFIRELEAERDVLRVSGIHVFEQTNPRSGARTVSSNRAEVEARRVGIEDAIAAARALALEAVPAADVRSRLQAIRAAMPAAV